MLITQDHITKIHSLLDAGLSKGLGEPEPGKMCVEAAICYALGLPHSDDPGCVSPALRSLKITLNDSAWSSNKARAEGMRRLAIAQLGSKDVLDEQEFAKRVARLAIQTVIPAVFRKVAPLLTGEHPTKLLVLAAQCESEPTETNAHAATYAATYAARAAYAAGRAAARAAADAADAAAADEILAPFAEGVVQILIEMKAPGCQWL